MSDLTTYPLDLFDDPADPEVAEKQKKCTDLRANQLLNLLKSKKLDPELVATTQGASITLYHLTLKRPLGRKAMRDLEDEILLSLICHPVRVYQGEGNSIYVEIPSEYRTFFSLRSLLEEKAFQKASSALTFAVGRDIEGTPILADLAKLPHLLITGRDGSGRICSVHTLLLSLLYKSTPEQLKLILVDPTKVEFPAFNGLKHLWVPVITHPKTAFAALRFVLQDLETRYSLLKKADCRSIDDYNKKKPADMPVLPRLVIVIDSFDHLTLLSRKEFIDSVTRIAMKGRAVGVHLVLSTDRPEPNVLDSLVSANIPSRLALSAVTAIQSRRVIFTKGAERLLDRGDAYYLPMGALAPIRVQCPYVSDEEVQRIADALRGSDDEEAVYDRFVLSSIKKEEEEGQKSKKTAKKPQSKPQTAPPKKEEPAPAAESLEDPLYDQAVEMVLTQGVCNVSGLQRTLGIGYGRAAMLVDMLTERGVLSYPDGVTHTRTPLITKEQWKKSDAPSEKLLFDQTTEDFDPLVIDAVDAVLEYGKATTAVLQRKLAIGYSKAIRLLEQLDRAGVIALYASNGEHAILITKEEWAKQKELLGKKSC